MRKYLLLTFLHIILQSFLVCSGGQTAINFTGNDSYIYIDDSPETDLSVFTVECWFMRKDSGISVLTGSDSIYAVPIIAKGIEEAAGQASMNYFLGIKREDSILVAAFEESNSGASPGKNHHITGFTTIKRNIWYHAAVTYDGMFMKLYLNGILESALEINKQPENQSPVKTAIGAVLLEGDVPAGSFAGLIDEIRLWNYARTQAEIQNQINREIISPRNGLVLRLGLNEGTGNEISYTGIPGLNPGIAGTGWKWEPGTHFENINPPLCNESPLLKIGLIADPQYSEYPPEGTRYYRETLKKLPAAIDTFNKYEVDFVMTLGDVIDRYYESFDSILPLYNNLNMPDYKLLGNHAFWGIDDSLKDTVIYLFNMPDYYYYFTYNDWRFVILDGTELAAYDSILHPDLRDEADSLWQSVQGKINDATWNGGIGRKQRQWIENTINGAMNNDEKVILFCHFPVYPEHSKNLWNCEQIIEIIEKYDNIVAYINGHNHSGNYGFLNGKHYITQKAMVESYDTSSYSILEIYDNKLCFNNYGLMKDHTRSYRHNCTKPHDIILSGNILTYAIDSGDYIGSFSAIDSSCTGNYSYGLTDGYAFEHNSLFNISNDSLFLVTSQNLARQEKYYIKVSAMNCYLDTVTKVFEINFDTNAVHIQKHIPDTVLFIGQDNLNIRMDSVFEDKSEKGLVYSAVSGNPGKASADIDDKSLVVQQISAGESEIIVVAADSFTNQSVSDTFLVTVIDPFNHAPEIINTIGDKFLQLYFDTLVIDLDTIFYDPDGDTLGYLADISNPEILDAAMTGSELMLAPKSEGNASVEISADDDRGGIITDGFIVSVSYVNTISYNRQEMLCLMNFPNPVNRESIFIYYVEENCYVRLSMFNQYGNLVKVLVSEQQDRGNKEVVVSVSDLTPGIYFVRLEIGDRPAETIKVVVKGIAKGTAP